MPHDWIIKELKDLQHYAHLNGLAALGEHLEQAVLLAMTEIASAPNADRDSGVQDEPCTGAQN